MDNPISDIEMRKYIPNVVTYDQLEHLTQLPLPLVILYITAFSPPNKKGHWVLLHRTPEGIEFFDSYGYKPDREFNDISPKLHYPHYLDHLLHRIKSPVHYNDYSFQSPISNTCGRWVILRNYFSRYKIDNFISAILEVSAAHSLTPDQLILKIPLPSYNRKAPFS